MRLLIFGGTSDARKLVQQLGERHQVSLCVVSDYARHLLPEPSEYFEVLVGPKLAADIAAMLPEYDLVIDAAHPYAGSIHNTLKRVVPKDRLRRLKRDLPDSDGLSSYQAMVDHLKDRPGNILLTSGLGSAAAFLPLADRAYLRLLPDPTNLQRAIELGFLPSHLIAMQGPFTQALNEAMMESLAIKYLVTKASGQAGGFHEKQAAAKALGVELLILAPPPPEGLSLDELLEELL